LKGSNATGGIFPQAPGNTFTFNRSVGADWLLLLTERSGFDWGNWFPYLTAGFAVANLKATPLLTPPVPIAPLPGRSIRQLLALHGAPDLSGDGTIIGRYVVNICTFGSRMMSRGKRSQRILPSLGLAPRSLTTTRRLAKTLGGEHSATGGDRLNEALGV